jgi:hypothetical protein
VGTVTKPGLGLPVGGPAINRTPRQMIAQSVGEVVDLTAAGVRIVISVPGGEKMARKTTNARLGIVGGISILGTTGIVRPFSTASWRASVVQAVHVMAAQGERTVVLCTGGRTERAAMALLPDLPEVCFVEVGDFTGAAVTAAVEDGLGDVVFVGMAGKLAKLAAGSDDALHPLEGGPGPAARVTEEAGGTRAGCGRRGGQHQQHAYELWEANGLLRTAGDLLCARAGGARALRRGADRGRRDGRLRRAADGGLVGAVGGVTGSSGAPVTVIGIDAAGAVRLPDGAGEAVAGAALLVGAERHLAAVQPPDHCERVVLGPLEPALRRLSEVAGAGRPAVVLAGGDPGFFGIVRRLREGGSRRASCRRPPASPRPSPAPGFPGTALPWSPRTAVTCARR